VLTGSHNWTSSADTKNDENTVIVHNDTIANVYLQAFAGDFKNISGNTMTRTNNPCQTGIETNNAGSKYATAYPNPFSDAVNIEVNKSLNPVSIKIFNQIGQCLYSIPTSGNSITVDTRELNSGIYFLVIATADRNYSLKLAK
jgi:hypothetical protein